MLSRREGESKRSAPKRNVWGIDAVSKVTQSPSVSSCHRQISEDLGQNIADARRKLETNAMLSKQNRPDLIVFCINTRPGVIQPAELPIQLEVDTFGQSGRLHRVRVNGM